MDCNTDLGDGCEVSVTSDPAHRGGCGVACPDRADATATCASSLCGIACTAGFRNCDGDTTNGCERPVVSDADNCGACGNACGTTGINQVPYCDSERCNTRCEAGCVECESRGCITGPLATFPIAGCTEVSGTAVRSLAINDAEICTWLRAWTANLGG